MKNKIINILRSIGSVIAGFLTVVIFSIGTDTILEKIGFFPSIGEGVLSSPMLLLALFYRTVYTLAGGYVTALLAPRVPMKHVAVLGVLGTIGGIAGVVAGWNLSAHWYPIALALLAFPSVWIGGALRVRK